MPSRPAPFAFLRCSSSSSVTPSLKLVAQLRKRTTATIQKAREALIASHCDVSDALEWLERDRITTGKRKAEKFKNRFAGEGLIGITVLSQGTGNPLGLRAAMVELNCETDFVGRNELFRTLVQDLSFTAAFIEDPTPTLSTANEAQHFMRPIQLSYLRDAPLMLRDRSDNRKTVSDSIRDTISAVGENITIRRAMSLVYDPVPPASGMGLRVLSHVHGALATPQDKNSVAMEAQGKIGALVAVGLRTSPASRLSKLLESPAFELGLSTLGRGLARQIVGMRPESVRGDGDGALYNQPFDMLVTTEGQCVEAVLKKWAKEQNMTEEEDDVGGLSVIEFSRWEVGEGL